MTRFARLFALSMGLLALGAQSARCALTLEQAYERAEERSEDLDISMAEWRAAEARYRQAVGAGGPEIRGEGGASWQDTGSSPSRSDHDYRAGVGASWTVFNGFRTVREGEALRAEGQAIQFDRARMRQLLYQDVADVFYQVLAYDGELARLGEQVESLQQLERDLEERLKLGKSRRAEVLASHSQLARVLVSAEEIKGLRGAAMELLAFLTGLPSAELAPVETSDLPSQETVDRFLEAARSRPDLRAAASRIVASSRHVEAAEADRKPEVALDGNVYLVRDPDDEGQWDISLQAALPLFDRGARRARVAEQAEGLTISELRLSRLERSTELDVRSAFQEVLATFAQSSALDDAIRIGAENYETQKRDYELGRSANVDVINALIDVQELRRQQAVLEMRQRAALVHLHVAAGMQAP